MLASAGGRFPRSSCRRMFQDVSNAALAAEFWPSPQESVASLDHLVEPSLSLKLAFLNEALQKEINAGAWDKARRYFEAAAEVFVEASRGELPIAPATVAFYHWARVRFQLGKDRLPGDEAYARADPAVINDLRLTVEACCEETFENRGFILCMARIHLSSIAYWHRKLEVARSMIDRAADVAENFNEIRDSQKLTLFHLIGGRYGELYEFDRALEIFDQAVAVAKDSSDCTPSERARAALDFCERASDGLKYAADESAPRERVTQRRKIIEYGRYGIQLLCSGDTLSPLERGIVLELLRVLREIDLSLQIRVVRGGNELPIEQSQYEIE